MISHPDPQDDPTTPVGGGGGIETAASLNGANVVLTWTGGTAPFVIQRRASLASGTWTDVLHHQRPHRLCPRTAPARSSKSGQ
ncbi:MAG: hypothetical protein KIT22_01105 [Verrucomicrobiae bacterium]|nr:hypothetical protein [Verrucomicrobiae bacterium]